jgi:hypothetical protein
LKIKFNENYEEIHNTIIQILKSNDIFEKFFLIKLRSYLPIKIEIFLTYKLEDDVLNFILLNKQLNILDFLKKSEVLDENENNNMIKIYNLPLIQNKFDGTYLTYLKEKIKFSNNKTIQFMNLSTGIIIKDAFSIISEKNTLENENYIDYLNKYLYNKFKSEYYNIKDSFNEHMKNYQLFLNQYIIDMFNSKDNIEKENDKNNDETYSIDRKYFDFINFFEKLETNMKLFNTFYYNLRSFK